MPHRITVPPQFVPAVTGDPDVLAVVDIWVFRRQAIVSGPCAQGGRGADGDHSVHRPVAELDLQREHRTRGRLLCPAPAHSRENGATSAPGPLPEAVPRTMTTGGSSAWRTRICAHPLFSAATIGAPVTLSGVVVDPPGRIGCRPDRVSGPIPVGPISVGPIPVGRIASDVSMNGLPMRRGSGGPSGPGHRPVCVDRRYGHRWLT